MIVLVVMETMKCGQCSFCVTQACELVDGKNLSPRGHSGSWKWQLARTTKFIFHEELDLPSECAGATLAPKSEDKAIKSNQSVSSKQ